MYKGEIHPICSKIFHDNIQESFKKNQALKTSTSCSYLRMTDCWETETSVMETILAFHAEMLAVQLLRQERSQYFLSQWEYCNSDSAFLTSIWAHTPSEVFHHNILNTDLLSLAHLTFTCYDAYSPNQPSCFLQYAVTKPL